MRNIRPGCRRCAPRSPAHVDHADLEAITTGRRRSPSNSSGAGRCDRAHADHRAVGERDAGRAVPQLHQQRVEAVERPPRRSSSRRSPTPAGSSSTPRLRRSAGGWAVRAPRQRGVSRARRTRSETPCRFGSRLAANITVPSVLLLHRVDLAVVGDEPVQVSKPRREGVNWRSGCAPAATPTRNARRKVGVERRLWLRKVRHPCRRQCVTGDRKYVHRRRARVRRLRAT